MNNKFIFSHKEVLKATKSTSNKLQYLERKELITPYRIEKTGKATVLYSLEQMIAICLDIQLKGIDNLFADSIVKFLAEFDKPSGFDYSGQSLYCLAGFTSFDITDLAPDIKLPSQYTLVIVPDLGEILASIMVNAMGSDVINFESFRDRVISRFFCTDNSLLQKLY